MISKSNIALLQLIFDFFVLFKGLRRCESSVLHCVSQTTIPSVCSFINWLMLTILNVNPFEFVIEDILFFGVTAEIDHLEVSLGCGVQGWICTFIYISFQHSWSLILLREMIQVLKIQTIGEIE